MKPLALAVVLLFATVGSAFAADENIRCVQQVLAQESFYTSTIDGLNGPGTQSAAEAFYGSENAPDLPDPGPGGSSFNAYVAAQWCQALDPVHLADGMWMGPIEQGCGYLFARDQEIHSYQSSVCSQGGPVRMFFTVPNERISEAPAFEGRMLQIEQAMFVVTEVGNDTLTGVWTFGDYTEVVTFSLQDFDLLALNPDTYGLKEYRED